MSAAKIGTIPGPNGKRQVTYNHHPLYYYAGDRRSGQTAGQGLAAYGAEWWGVAPSGKTIGRG